jgi:hypothetical protein
MSQELIDFGVFPNDPDADAIRTAFQKSQNNFTELYTLTVSTGVVSVQPGAGISVNQTQGNVTVTANISSVTVQTANNLRVGIGTPTGQTATITTASTPIAMDLAANIVVNKVTANFISGALTAGPQPGITGIGALNNLTVTGDITASNFRGNVIGGTIKGTFSAPGSNTQVMYNNSGVFDGSPNLTWDGLTLTVRGDIDADNIQSNTVTAVGTIIAGNANLGDTASANHFISLDINTGNATANFFIGNGSLLTGIELANMANYANYANFAGGIIGGNAGQLLIQTGVDTTGFANVGNVGDVLISDSANGIYWANGTISGIALGNTLAALKNGNWILSNANAYNGNIDVQFDVDGSVTADPDKVVVRDPGGNVFAEYIFANILNPVSATIDIANLHISGGTINYVLTTDGAGALSWLDVSGIVGSNPLPASSVVAAGTDTQVQFNDNGSTAGHANFTWDKTTETLFATNYEGNGFTLECTSGPNVLGPVLWARNLFEGTGGEVPYQAQPNVTKFVPPGTNGDAFISTGTGSPKWVKGTISGTPIGQNLPKLLPGSFLTGSTGYDGTSGQTFSVDATSAPTGSKIVVRNASGNIEAKGISGTTIILTDATPSISYTTGAAIITGGMGVGGNIISNENISAKSFFGNFYGNFVGSFETDAPTKTVLFMEPGGKVGNDSKFYYDKSQESLVAPIFRGLGSGLDDIPGSNVTGKVATAILADNATKAATADLATRAINFDGGSAGGVVYQKATGSTGITSPGDAGQFLKSSGGGAPTWAAGTISTIPLGDNLKTLTFGTGFEKSGSTYIGKDALTIAVDLDVAGTADKIVKRKSDGGINASGESNLGDKVTAKLFVGDIQGSITDAVNATFAGTVKTADQPNITAVGTLTKLAVTGGITSGGTIEGKSFIGNGSGLTNIKTADVANLVVGSNVSGKVASATYADTTGASLSAANILGGVFGSIPYQNGVSTTAMLAPGTADQALISGGTGAAPKWVAGTISGIKLGKDLKDHSNGAYIIGGKYNGSGDIIWSVDAVSGNTANKIVLRDTSSNFEAGNITAVQFIGNLKGNISGGGDTTVIYQTAKDTTAFLTKGQPNQVLTMAPSGTGLAWTLPQISGVGLGGTLKNLTAGYGLAGGYYNGTGDITFTVDSTPLALANRVANRDSTGSMYMNVAYAIGLNAGSASAAGTITGNWVLSSGSKLMATYSDLAEYYAGDKDIESGTVVEFGGDNEITTSMTPMSAKVAGIVTTAPAYVMNSNIDCEFPVSLALQGRVPCKVVGDIAKGDIMVSAGNGRAMACSQPIMGSIIGKSLENFTGTEGIVEIAVGRL